MHAEPHLILPASAIRNIYEAVCREFAIYEDSSNEIHIIWTYFTASRHLPCGMQMTSKPKELSSALQQKFFSDSFASCILDVIIVSK